MRLPARLSIDLAQPVPVVTVWGSDGMALTCILIATIFTATIAYATAIASDPPSRRVTLACAAATMLAGALWLPIFSSDVYAYAAYGEFARLGANPYAHPVIPQGSPLLDAALWQWRPAIPGCVYGPGFITIAQAIVTMTHALSLSLTLNAFRLLSCIALLACGAIVPRRQAFFLCCNPVALWAAIEGHNDTLMVFAVLAGIAVSTIYPRVGVALATLGALIKAPALAAGAALGFHRSIVGFLVGVAIVVLATGPLVIGISNGVAAHGHYLPLASVQAVSPILAAALGTLVLLRMRVMTDPIDRWCLAALALWPAIPNPYAWYSLWILPIAAFSRDRRVAYTTIAVSGAAMFRYIPDAVALPHGLLAILLALPATVAYAPLFTRAIIIRS